MTSPSTVFPVASLDRGAVRWEDHLAALTPVEAGPSGLLYKREDKFAPLGYGGINGAKLRQLIHLVARQTARHPGTRGIMTAASVLSPQVSMAALVGAHFGLPVSVVLGATRPDTAVKHENVAIATRAGAQFIYTPVGFNPALQRACTLELQRFRYRDYYRLCYGITTPDDAADREVEAFHRVGAAQAANIPDGVRTLVMTAGSCNSVTSVLYGIARHQPAGLRRVFLTGIGPTRLDWLWRRLGQIERATGTEIRSLFTRRYLHHPDKSGGNGPILLEHHDLHATGWVTYQDKKRWTQDGIDFHPTYEGKAMTYLAERSPGWWEKPKGDVLFWIVGSAPSAAAMDAHLPRLAAAQPRPRVVLR